MKQANVRSGHVQDNPRHLIVDSSPSSDDDSAWNHSADYISINRHKSNGKLLRRPASEVQLRCCRSAAMGHSCNCVKDVAENIDYSEKGFLNKIESLTNHVQELQIKEVTLMGKLRLLKEETAQKDNVIKELQGEVTTLLHEKNAAEIKATSFTHNVQVLEAKIEDYKNNSKRADELHVEKLSSTVKSVENLQQSFDLERRKWQAETKVLVAQLEDSNSERQQLMKKLEEVRSQGENNMREKESLLKEKTNEIVAAENNLVSAKERILKLETQLSGFDSLKAENMELKKQNAALRRQMDETYGQLVEHQLKQFQNSNDGSQVSCEFNRLPQKQGLVVKGQPHRRNSSSSTISSSSSVLSCGDLLGHTNGSHSDSDNTVTVPPQAGSNQQLLSRVDALLGELRLSNGKFQMEHEKCVKLEVNLKKSENESEQLRQMLEKSRQQVVEKHQENENTLSEFFEMRNKLNSSVEQLAKDTEEIARLESELKTAEQDLAKKTAEVEKLKQTVSSTGGLQARLAEAEQLARRFADECDQRQTKIDQMSLQLDGLFDSRHSQRVAYEEQIDALRQEITRQTTEARAKADLSSTYELQVKKLESEMGLMKKAVEQTKRDETLLRVELETNYVNAQSEFVHKYQKLEAALKDATMKLREADDQRKDVESKFDAVIDSRDRRASELEQMIVGEKAIVEKRMAEVTSLTSALREKEKSLARAQRRINDLESCEVRLQEQLTSVGQELANFKKIDEQRICELESSNQKLSEQLAKADRLNADLTARINHLQNQVVALQRNCESAVEKYAELEAKLVDAEAERVKMKAEQETLANSLQVKLGQESEFQTRLDDLVSELEASKRLVLEKDALISTLESDCHAFASRADGMEEMRRVTSKTADDFKRLANDQQDKIFCLENQLAERVEELRDVTAELRQRDAEMAIRRDQVFELESRVDGMRSDLETRNQRLEEALEQAQGELCVKITETTQLSNELTTCQAELAHLREVDGKFSGEVDSLRADAEEKKKLAIGWKKKYDKVEADRSKLEGRIKELENALTLVQGESSKMRQEIQSQVANVLSVKAETDSFRREVSNARSEVSRLRDELAQKEEQISMARAQASRLSDELESVRKQKSTLHDQLLSSIEQLKKTKAKMALKYEQQLRDLRLQNSILLNCDPALSPPPGATKSEKRVEKLSSNGNKFLSQFLPPTAAELVGGMMSPDRLDSAATSPFFNNGNSPPSPLRRTFSLRQNRSLLLADSTTTTDVEQTRGDDETSTVGGGSVDFSMASHSKLPGELLKHRSNSLSRNHAAGGNNCRPPLPRRK